MRNSGNEDTCFDTSWISKTKTCAPQYSFELVKRERLLHLLDEGLIRPLSCLIAPAGFGKSTLLKQWQERLGKRGINCAWVNLDEGDQDVRQFLAYVVSALHAAGADMGALHEAANLGFVGLSSTAIKMKLFAALERAEKRTVIVLDDFHRAASENVNLLIRDLIDHLSDKIHISIGSRLPIKVGMAELLASGRASEIAASSLRFSDKEVKEALANSTSRKILKRLQNRVEGWPIAVQIASLVGVERFANDGIFEGQETSAQHLADYFIDDIIQLKSDEVQSFLLDTSILNEFDCDSADWIREKRDSLSLLNQVDDLRALIVPVDDQSQLFRYHHLFGAGLKDVLQKRDPQRYRLLHQRAALWCSEKRLVAEAVRYSNAIKDFDLTRKILRENSDWITVRQFGGPSYLNRLFVGLPEQELEKDTELLFFKANARLCVGDLRSAYRYVQAGDARIKKDGATPRTLKDQLAIGTGVLSRVEYKMERGGGWLADRLELVEEIKETYPSAHATSAIIRCVLANQSFAYGEFQIGSAHLAEAKNDLDRVPYAITASYLEAMNGLAELWQNHPTMSVGHFQESARIAEEHLGPDCNMSYVGRSLYLISEYWRSGTTYKAVGELEAAVGAALEADGWYDVYALGYDSITHCHLSRDDPAAGSRALFEFEGAVDRLANQRLVQFAQLLRLYFYVAVENSFEANQLYDRVMEWRNVDGREKENLGWFHRSYAAFVCAYYLLRTGAAEDSLMLVDEALQEVQKADFVTMHVRSLLLRSKVLKQLGRKEEANSDLHNAIVEASRTSCLQAIVSDAEPEAIGVAISQILNGETVVPQPFTLDFCKVLRLSITSNQLSPKELRILHSLAEGLTNQAIAQRFKVSVDTVKFHLRSIFQKLGVRSRAEAVKEGQISGLL